MNRSGIMPWVIVLFLFGGTAIQRSANFLTDWMWFNAVGYSDVFVTTLLAQAVAGLGAGLIIMLSVWLSGRRALHHTRNRPIVLTGEWRGSWLDHWARQPGALEGALRAAAITLGVLALTVGIQGWRDLLAWWHAGAFDFRDPILDLDAGFYVFTYPVLFGLTSLGTAATFLAGATAVVIYSARGAIGLVIPEEDGELGAPLLRADPGPRRHLASLAATLAMLMAVQYHLRRYAVMFGTSQLMDGPGYTDVQVVLPLLTLQAVLMAVSGFLVFQAIDQLRGGLFIWAFLLVVTGTTVTAFLPGTVQQLLVLPNELNRESAYIAEHIRASRQAWGLDAVEERTLTGEAKLTYEDIQANDATIQNVRLWDHQPLLETFRQVQEIRTYYDFSGVDNDRYVIDGELRQTMLSPRELLADTLPEAAQTWVNQSLVYTHGYGVALGPVNRVTGEGLPYLFVQDIPPTSNGDASLEITRPELYYGERMRTPVFVQTGEREFDYPTADGNAYASYEGSGGVTISGIIRRVLMSMRLGSVEVLLSSDINAGSRLMLYRNVVERVERIAPFLWIDEDPYMVIADGRLKWIVEAYTHTDRFPYAAHERTPGPDRASASYPRGVTKHRPGRVNYVRNSVKVIVDAYDGSVELYQMDPDDPIANAWAGAYPDLFKDPSGISPTIREHLRYPRTLFGLQAKLFTAFHMTDSQMFYNREDEWEVPFWEVEPGSSVEARGWGRRKVSMSPYYTIMKLPGEDKEEFILMLPFVPKGKANLSAWMVARSDGDQYGGLRVYRFPKDRLIFGPGQIVSRILQDDQISEKLTLWNQQTSEAELGTLLVIPVEESLLYLRPLYLRASSDAIPELKRVIVAYENRIAMAPTLEEGLRDIFDVTGTVPPAATDSGDADPGAPMAIPSGLSWGVLADQATGLYNDAVQASRDGRWGDFGTALDDLGATLQALQAAQGTVEDATPEAPAPSDETADEDAETP